ncbi:uncharacterized protein LOC119767089 isoform X2 [Culex quinquefasciatus]|nr:uncharacterized protein LOC119767089 isoform X2 [Culex quinquefasciatus]
MVNFHLRGTIFHLQLDLVHLTVVDQLLASIESADDFFCFLQRVAFDVHFAFGEIRLDCCYFGFENNLDVSFNMAHGPFPCRDISKNSSLIFHREAAVEATPD